MTEQSSTYDPTMPPEPIPSSPIPPEVMERIRENHDAPLSQEIKVADNLSITLGVNHVYFNFDGAVYPVAHKQDREQT